MGEISTSQLLITILLICPLFSQSFFQQLPIITPSSKKTIKNNAKKSILEQKAVNNVNNNDDNNRNRVIPYVIQTIESNRKKNFEDLCKMTIQVFFNEDNNEDINGDDSNINDDSLPPTPPWKSVQLAYLRHLQFSDLRTRKYMSSGPQNDMFIAREVIITNKDEIDNLPPELLFPNNTETTTIIKNKNELPMLKDNEIYCLSNDVIGFVEVSSRIFYLPEEQQQQQGMIKQYRPVLTNLAVKKSARRSGVGTTLVKLCENTVTNVWDPAYNDIVLQVEDNNPRGYWFYKKLGYEFVYSDPSTRRFDTSGFFLKEVRSTKVCMRKILNKGIDDDVEKKNNDNNTNGFFFADFVSSGIRALREKVTN